MRFSNSQLFFGWQNSQGLQISSASLRIQPMPFQDVWFGWIWCHVYLKGRPLRVDSPWSKTAGSTWFNHVQSTMFNLVSVVFTMSWFNCVNTWFSLHPLAAFVRVTKWTRVCGWRKCRYAHAALSKQQAWSSGGDALVANRTLCCHTKRTGLQCLSRNAWGDQWHTLMEFGWKKGDIGK